MKKIFLSCCFLICCGSFIFAQQKDANVDDAIKLLEDNFVKYPWVHTLLANKTEDKRPEFVRISRLSYERDTDVNGEEQRLPAEIVYIEIRKGGYRYDIKLDFSTQKEKGAEMANTAKGKIFGRLLSDIYKQEKGA